MNNPIDLLPLPHPMDFDPSVGDVDYFYENVSKHLIKDVIRIMSNGISIDFDKVRELEKVVVDVLENVSTMLASNPIIEAFNADVYPKKFKALEMEFKSKKRDVDYYIKPYKDTMVHRTYAVNYYLRKSSSEHCCKEQWSVRDLKGLNIIVKDDFIARVIDKKLTEKEKENGMLDLATAKVEIYNKSIDVKLVEKGSKKSLISPFNPASSKQLGQLFEYLKVEPIKFTDSGAASWDRASIETVMRETTDEDLKELLQLFVDHSFSAIIKNNFIEAFEKFTIDGVLYGNIKLFGAKTFRLTSNSPNLLNAPSTGSIYAKPLKDCFVAREGFIVATADLEQLEDRVVANLTKDEGKCSIFLDDLDSHCYNALGYFGDRIAEHMEVTGDKVVDTKLFKKLVGEGNKELKAIRQEGKPATFGLSYGSHPPKVAATIKCTLPEAEEIFRSYHEDMYVGITTFREEVVLPSVREKGYVHMGMGCRLYSSNVGQEARTLWNSVSQFWSIITLLSINKIHSLIEEAGYEEDILCTSTIYDSIYFEVRDDAVIVEWLNRNLIPLMCTDLFEDTVVKNGASLELSDSWNNLIEIPNSATTEEIEAVLKEIKDRKC